MEFKNDIKELSLQVLERKNHIKALISNAIKYDITFTGCNGEKFTMELMPEIQVDSITVEGEDGNEITSADEISY